MQIERRVVVLSAVALLSVLGLMRTADVLGTQAGVLIAKHVTAPRPAPPPSEPIHPAPEQVEPPPEAASPQSGDNPLATRRRVPAARSVQAAPATQPVGTVIVPAAFILRAAQLGVEPPHGVPVPASGARPAGVMLTDVERFGAGLRNGDVVTVAGGVPALTEADVVTAVLTARGQRRANLSGRFWREQEEWGFVVGMPYLEADLAPPSNTN